MKFTEPLLPTTGNPPAVKTETAPFLDLTVVSDTAADGAAASQNAGHNELVVIDTSVAGYEALLENLGEDVEVVLLQGDGDAVEEMAAALAGRSDLDAIHILSHGGEGRLLLGDQEISSATLSGYEDELAVIGQALSDSGDLLLYGCDIASGTGEGFIYTLAEITGADVAASSDKTGNAADGGDWDLEIATGSIEADTPFSETALRDFSGVLAVFNGTVNLGSGSYTVVNAGSYGGAATANATFTVGSYTLVADGKDVGSYGGYADAGTYGVIFGKGASGIVESKAYLYFSGNKSFDITSLQIKHFDSANSHSFTVTSDKGGSVNVSSFAADSYTTVTLNWTGVTKITITPNSSVMFGTDNLVISNLGLAANANPDMTGEPASFTVTEDAATGITGTGANQLGLATISDTDATGNMTLTLTAGTGTLGFVDDANITETLSNGNKTLTLVGTMANLNTFIDTAGNITYTTASNSTTADTISITANDGEGSGDVAVASITTSVTAVNDDPTITGLPASVTVTEDVASNVDLSAATLSDVDSASGNITLTITAGAGTLSSSSGGGVTVGGTSTALTLTGTVANIDTFLNTASNIKYTTATNANGTPATTLTLTANDGGNTGTGGGGNVSLGTVNVNVTAVNDAPVLDNSKSPVLTSISEDLAAPSNGSTANSTLVSALIDNGGSLSNFTDVEGNSAGIAIVGVNSGTLYYTTNGGTTWTALGAVSANSALVLATDANTRVYFSPSSNVNGSITDAITFKAWDQTSSSNGSTGVDTTSGTAFSSSTDTVSVTVSAVNDDPTGASLPTDVTVTEDTASNLDLSALTLSDVDSASGSITLTLTASAGTMTASSSGGVTVSGSGSAALTLSGTVSNIDTWLNTASNIQYTGASNAQGNNAATLTLTANDGGNTGTGGGGNVSLGTVNIDITNVNDAPTASGTYTFTSINEDTTSTGVQVSTVVAGLTTADVDGNTLGLAISGTTGNGTWQFSSDSSNGTDGTWTAFNASQTPSAANSLLLANTSWIRYVPDALNGETATFTLRAWDQTSGSASVSGTARYADTSTNGGSTAFSTGTGAGSLTVTSVNDVPVVDLNAATGGNDNTTTFSAGGSAVAIANTDATLTDVDSGATISSLTATLTSRPDGDSVESLSLDSSATTAATNAGLTVGYTSGTGVLSITGAASASVYQSILRGVQYNNTDSAANVTTGNRSITVVANDGTGNSVSRTSTLSVVTAPVPDLNGATAGTGYTASFTEGNTNIALVDATGATLTEPDGDNVNLMTIQLTNAQDGTSESITLNGRANSDTVNGITITYDSATQITLSGSATAANYQALLRELIYNNTSENPDTTARTVTVSARDTNGNTGASAVATITISRVNDDPSVTGLPTSVTVTENLASNVDLSAMTLADPDAGSGTITLTIKAGAGTLSASSGSSVTVSGSGSGTLVLQGTVANIDTYLNTASNIKYTSASGTLSSSLTLTANDGGNTGSGGGTTVSLGSVTVTVNETAKITSATYNATTGVLVVTGVNIEANGSGSDIDASSFTLTGEGGQTYTLTDTADVERTSPTGFTLTLSATDKAAVNQIINKDGTSSTGGTAYNIAAADDWNTNVTAGDTADTTGNAVTASNVATPAITDADYNAATGVLTVTATGLLKASGATNDVDVSKLTFTGEGGTTYTLTDTSDVEITSATQFTVTLSATDKNGVNQLLNKIGGTSTDGTTYNLAAAEDWAKGADASVAVADTSGNAIDVSNVAAPSITSATYSRQTGTLKITGTNLLSYAGDDNDIDASTLTVTGLGGATYALTDTADVDITSSTQFSLVLSSTDKAGVEALLDKDGTQSSDATVYNLAGAEDWNRGADAAVDIADTTGNSITADLNVSSGGASGSSGGGTGTTDDNDGVSRSEEDQVPSLTEDGVTGDGNGDGIQDSTQADVASAAFRATDHISTNPDAQETYVTLVAGAAAQEGSSEDTGTAELQNVRQIDAPEDLPAAANMPLGLISFEAETDSEGETVSFSLYVDESLLVNGYWKQDSTGEWVNLASAESGGSLVTENGKTRLDFTITDGGEFDNDGEADGVITDPGGAGYLSNLTLFDETYYLNSKLSQLIEEGITGYSSAAEVKAAINNAGMTTYEHFLRYSLTENTDPSAYFNTQEYMLAKVAQLNEIAYQGRTDWTLENTAAAFEAAGYTNALEHFQEWGWQEDVNPSNEVDLSKYFEVKADLVDMTVDEVKAAFLDAGLSPLSHWEAYGQYEEGLYLSEVSAEEIVDQFATELELLGVQIFEDTVLL